MPQWNCHYHRTNNFGVHKNSSRINSVQSVQLLQAGHSCLQCLRKQTEVGNTADINMRNFYSYHKYDFIKKTYQHMTEDNNGKQNVNKLQT